MLVKIYFPNFALPTFDIKLINSVLEPREREIIIQRYGLYDVIPKTQSEIAEKCNISRSYVSRIEKKALEKLREHFEKK